MATSLAKANKLDNALPGFSITVDSPSNDKPSADAVANTTSMDLKETYLRLVENNKDLAILTITQELYIRSVALTMDNKNEVEAIVDSGSQIISIAAKVTNNFGLIYDPTVILNMQSANSIVDRSLGLIKNIPCIIDNITFYL